MRYEVSIGFHVHTDGDGLDVHLDQVMDELELLDVTDPDFSGSLARGEVEITLIVEAEGAVEATALASAAIRSAIHAAQGATPTGRLSVTTWSRPHPVEELVAS
jgi:hypothetical protein